MFNRGGFHGQRPMGHGPMNQPGMGHGPMNQPGMGHGPMNQPGMGHGPMNQSGMGHPGMNMSGMNMSGMGMAPMNQQSMNLSSMNHPGMNNQHMGHPGMTHSNIGLSGMNQPNMNLNQMNHPGMNQGGGGGGGGRGMGFLPEMKNPAFGMRPMNNTGSFGGNTDPIGMKSIPVRPSMHTPSDRLMSPQVLPQRFPSPSVPAHQGQQRMPSQNQEIPSIVNRILSHSSDRMMMKPKTPLQDPAALMKKKRWDDLDAFGNVGPEMGMKPIQSDPSLEKRPNAQNRYTNESASSILESFGLSNEDLEELSRYPDDQLTPSNMPGILRDIRLRKMNLTTPVPDQTTGRRPGSEAVASKVIDYGHSSKYPFNDSVPPARSYSPPRTEQKPPPLPKETAAPSNTKPEMTPEKGMDNKIPTISGSRKPIRLSSKPDRSNNKTLIGKETAAPVDVSVTVSKIEQPVISIQADASTIPDAATSVQTELKPAVQSITAVSQVGYQQPAEMPAPVKGGWVPLLSQEEAQRMKRLPTPSMMNDYYAASPRIFPHICSLCNVECRHLKDWIKHQNSSSHIESCRNLRQQYPDWNPQELSSVSNEGKNAETTSKTSLKSKSTSPRRSRRSGSRHRSRKSHSRSPRSSGRRSRSRSPRRSRNSPRRSRSPRLGQRSPCRSRSPRRYRTSNAKSPDKRAVDAAVQSFIEATKRLKGIKSSRNGKKLPPKPSNPITKNKKPASSAPPPKRSGTTAPKPRSSSSSSSSSKKPNSSTNTADKAGSSNAAQKSSSTGSSTKKPTSGSSNYKKPVVSTGGKKTISSASSGKKPLPGKLPAPKNPSSQTATSTETCSLLNNFTSKNSIGKIVHVTNLPDTGYTDQDLVKIVQPFGKVCDVLIIRSKNEAFMETSFRAAATAAVKFSESTPVMINNQRVTLTLAGQTKKSMKTVDEAATVKEPAIAAAPAEAPKIEHTEAKLEEKSKRELEVPPGFIRRYMLDDPPLKQAEQCVILISNLPEAQYTVNEITNLAKPFGGVNDILVVANHRKVYLELTSRNSLDSMIKFYSVFPTYLGGNLLSISIATRYKDLKDEDLIFADLIEQAAYKITPSIYETFVHLTNLPDKDVEDFEIIRVGLRFGKVEHHVYLSNKKKAILHLHSLSAAKAMHSFLTQYPCSIKENVLQCSLPSKTKLAEDEYMSYIEESIQSPKIVMKKPAPATRASEETTNKKSKEGAAAPPPTKHAKEGAAAPPPTKHAKEGAAAPPPTKHAKEGAAAPPPTKHAKEGAAAPPPTKHAKEGAAAQPPTKHAKEGAAAPPPTKDAKEGAAAPPPTKDAKEGAAAPPPTKDAKEGAAAPPPTKDANEGAAAPPSSKDANEGAVAPPSSKDANEGAVVAPSSKDAIRSDKTPAPVPAKPLIPAPFSSCYSVVATEDDGDEEEAAEAPEAPDTLPLYVQAETETQQQDSHPVSQPLLSEELEVLVSVESDEEESEELYPFILGIKRGPPFLPIVQKNQIETPRPSSNAEAVGKKASEDGQNAISGPSRIPENKGVGNKTADTSNTEGPSTDKVQDPSTESSNVEDTKDHSVVPVGKTELPPFKADEGSKETSKAAHPVPEKGRAESEAPEMTPVAATSSGSMIRTTKYNAQKGEISVTVTLESQKSIAKTAESKKKTSREWGTSLRESSTPKSNSNRSSPANGTSSHSKSGSNFPQKKSTGKYVSSQPERDSKDMSRSRERDARSSSRKDDRTRGSSSSRYTRSSKSNNRSPRSKEEEETFPFNLDEFVTVDEIVEEHVDPKKKSKEREEKPDARKGKRKDNDPLPSDTKKSRVTSTDLHEASFVTLDEVGDEEDNAGNQDNLADQAAQSMVTLDEVHAEDGPPARAKGDKVLLTLDEISDEDDAQDSSAGRPSSSVPEILPKEKLLTLDEVNEEDEGHTTPPKPSKGVETKLAEATKDTGRKEDNSNKKMEAKPEAKAQQDAGDRSQRPLLTLDEVKADDDDMSFADMEHQFLTVDEIGEEEEDPAEKERKSDDRSKLPESKHSGSSKAETTPRGRLQKRSLPQGADDNMGSSQQVSPDTSLGAAPKRTPDKAKPSIGHDRGAAQGTSAPKDKAESAPADNQPAAETPAKKTKLESTPAEKTKLMPFNSSIAVGMEFLVPKTGYFCELCSLFYMDDSSKLKHCKSLRHYQAVEKHLAKLEAAPKGKSSST
ncbi:zinc finger protein 638 isoform X2 [Eleutherodactylus coqui]|uniref:zinc finger protein 638 isoform X2 n=1 Tax=Eleutherodactylus coqui TaxID=57060 RepID=UPI0034623C8E